MLQCIPLDQYSAQPAGIMRRVPADEAKNLPVEIYSLFQQQLDTAADKKVDMELIERFEFYARAKKCYAVIQASLEHRLYANIIITKGVIIRK